MFRPHTFGEGYRRALASLSLFCVLFLVPTLARAENIESFIADIEVRKDATFTVMEEITYTFDGERHGIFRFIPRLHQDPSSSLLKDRYIDINIESVTMNGEPVPFVEDTVYGEVRLKIGDPNSTITGTHTYNISYTVGGGLSYEENGGAELYWNVTGNGWDVPMEYVEARVSSPDGILLRERACYRGVEDEANSCERMVEENGIVKFSGGLFLPHHGLTIAQAVNRAVVVYDVRERYKSVLLWSLLLLGGLLVAGIALYRYKTKFKTDAPIIPQYEPYPGVKPMYAGLLFDKRLDPRDITAGIVYLAEQGFLKIRKIETKVLFFFEVDDYEITLVKPALELGSAFERELLTLLFGISAPEAGDKVTLQKLKNDRAQARENWAFLQNLKSKLRDDLRAQGFYIGFEFKTLAGTRAIPLILILLFAWYVSIVAFFVALVVLVILAAIFAGGRRTKKGYEALDHLKGFKDYLSVTDKDRFIFHNAPERNAEQFMEYLPYAIAFGVEKQWAKTFEHITIPNPDWYDGGSGVTSFNAGSLTQSLGAFSTAFAATSASGSASSGGGSSGGGGGGGGGGSW